jgi:SH3 domain-containing YSC84-like protein 1
VVNVTAEMCLLQRQGLAIITVLKEGFLGSGRYGNGIVVARLSDGSWSAPSAIGLGGAGFGGQIGFELMHFVFVLNDAAAVRAFSQQGSLTLGGNVSLAAGPIGRNAEAAGAASLKGVAGVFGYSKTKGLFTGVLLEGSAVVERRDANEKLYGQRYTASHLMEGSVRPPPAAASLMNVLNSRVFAGVAGGGDAMYNDIPQYDDQREDVVWEGRRWSGYGEGIRRNRNGSYTDTIYKGVPLYDDRHDNTAGLKRNQAVALHTFEADLPGDLGFKKGEIITVTKKTDKAEDWWYVSFLYLSSDECDLTCYKRTGMIGTRVGIFPSNYVEAKNY